MDISLINSKGSTIVSFMVTVPEPVKALFVKDRHTRQNYILIRTDGPDTTSTPRQLIPVPWDQYSGLYIRYSNS